jgi:hypothetical protein
MISGVWDRGPDGNPFTPEQAEQWKQNLQHIIQAGATSVPAIAEFLSLNQDAFFSAEEGKLLGYRSARAALLDALVKIGGPEATGVLGDVLQATASPREIAMLARDLEAAAPGQYREQAVAAARQSLAMAVEKQLEGFDVAPLFEVLQHFGGAGVVDDLERAAGQWNYYATLALANLPDGAGVPSLIRMVDAGPSGRSNPGRLQALQVLAQLAASNPDARATLVEQARANRISAHLWPYLARPLAGDQAHVQDSVLNENRPVPDDLRTGSAHIARGNQNFFWAPAGGGLSAEEISQQLALINQLESATVDPDAQRVLEQTRALLEQRLGQSAGVTPPVK